MLGLWCSRGHKRPTKGPRIVLETFMIKHSIPDTVTIIIYITSAPVNLGSFCPPSTTLVWREMLIPSHEHVLHEQSRSGYQSWSKKNSSSSLKPREGQEWKVDLFILGSWNRAWGTLGLTYRHKRQIFTTMLLLTGQGPFTESPRPIAYIKLLISCQLLHPSENLVSRTSRLRDSLGCSTYDIRPAEGHGILMNKGIAAAFAADSAMPFMSRYHT